jgi:DNA invertase Pin-like site-specific DNA recombinase
MLADIRANIIDCVVVKDLSRFGRNHIETGNYLEHVFPFMGVRFISVGDNYDSQFSSVDDGLIIPLKNLINEAYAKDISKKLRSKFQMKMKKGEFCGTFAPYGYIAEAGKLKIDPTAAAVVRQIFAMVLDGQSDNVIARHLNEEGVLPPKRYRYEQGLLKSEKYKAVKFWYKSVVKRITENPAYIGILVQGKHRRNITQGRVIYVNPDEWITSEATHPPIVERDIFEAVKALRTNRKQQYDEKLAGSSRPRASENIFHGLVFCADCGRVLGRYKQGRKAEHIRYRFKCHTYIQNKFCSPKSISESELYGIVQKLLETQMQALADVKQIFSEVQKQSAYIRKGNALDENIAAVTVRLSKITDLRSSLYEDFKEGILTKDDYSLAKSQYEAEQGKLAEKLENLKEQKTQQTDMVSENKWAKSYTEFSGNLHLTWEMLVCLIERITIDSENNVHIQLKYRDEYEHLLRSLGKYTNEAAS